MVSFLKNAAEGRERARLERLRIQKEKVCRCMYICMYVYIYMFMCVLACLCVDICLFIYIYMAICVCGYVFVCANTRCIHFNSRILVYGLYCMYITCACMHMCVY